MSERRRRPALLETVKHWAAEQVRPLAVHEITTCRSLTRIADTGWLHLPAAQPLHQRRYDAIRKLADGELKSKKVWTVEDVRFLVDIIEGRVVLEEDGEHAHLATSGGHRAPR